MTLMTLLHQDSCTLGGGLFGAAGTGHDRHIRQAVMAPALPEPPTASIPEFCLAGGHRGPSVALLSSVEGRAPSSTRENAALSTTVATSGAPRDVISRSFEPPHGAEEATALSAALEPATGALPEQRHDGADEGRENGLDDGHGGSIGRSQSASRAPRIHHAERAIPGLSTASLAVAPALLQAALDAGRRPSTLVLHVDGATVTLESRSELAAALKRAGLSPLARRVERMLVPADAILTFVDTDAGATGLVVLRVAEVLGR